MKETKSNTISAKARIIIVTDDLDRRMRVFANVMIDRILEDMSKGILNVPKKSDTL